MSTLSPDHIQPWIANRIVHFFNQAKSISEITRVVQDDPSDGKGGAIGRTVARRILQKRDQLGWRRFRSLNDIYEVDGMGPDKLSDLVYSLGISAAEALVDALYDDQVLFRANWPLKYYSIHVESSEAFDQVVQDEKTFRGTIAQHLEAICQEEGVDAATQERMLTGVQTAYIDPYNNSSSDYPAYEFAQWFYSIDMGNFFFFERGIPYTRRYFEYHPGSPWEMELRMFKGVRGDLIPGGIIPHDLATVVNYPEQVITIWATALFD